MLGRIVAAEKLLLVRCCARYDDDGLSPWEANGENAKQKHRVRYGMTQSFDRPRDDTSRSQGSRGGHGTRESKIWEFPEEAYDYDSFEEDEEDEEDEDEVEEDEVDFRTVFGLFGIGLPAAFVAVPWLINHPMALTVVFAVAPVVQGAFRLAVKILSSSSQTRSRFRANYRSRLSRSASSPYRRHRFSERTRDDYMYDPYRRDERMQQQRPITKQGSGEDETSDSSSWEIPAARGSEEDGTMEGWIELANDKLWSVQRSRRTAKARRRRLARSDIPFFWRIIIAAFPFLRSWGGFL